MHTFFLPQLSTSETFCLLNEDESKHAIKVLRLSIGDKINILNGKGDEFLAEITEAKTKHAELKIISVVSEPASIFEIHIAIAPTKNMDRLEWFAEKATELGITTITPLICQNSERTKLNIDRLQKIVISAMKQSKRKHLPLVEDPVKFKDFLKLHPKGALAHCYKGDKYPLASVMMFKNFPILIGPEGDFSEEEVALAQKSGYFAISLGKNRLRTETAGLYACMAAKIKFEQ
jgi:16S rRNA (uracil1498-N3)-methyltransferase